MFFIFYFLFTATFINANEAGVKEKKGKENGFKAKFQLAISKAKNLNQRTLAIVAGAIFVLILIILFLTSKIFKNKALPKDEELKQAKIEIENLKNEITQLKEEKQNLENEINNLQVALKEAKDTIINRDVRIKNLQNLINLTHPNPFTAEPAGITENVAEPAETTKNTTQERVNVNEWDDSPLYINPRNSAF